MCADGKTIQIATRPDPSLVDDPSKRRSLLAHGLGLAIVLFTLIPIVGTDGPWSADVGAQLYQAEALADGRSTFDHPFPAADPDGVLYPVHLSLWSADRTGYVVYNKNVGHTLVVGVLLGLGGFTAVVALSTVGTLAAAVGTARLASLVDRGAAVPALWLAGLGSPLLFHAYHGYGHAVAAAGLAWAAWMALRFAAGGRWWLLVGAALLLVTIAQVRTEAPLAGLALAVGLGVQIGIRSSLAAGVVGVATVSGAVINRLTMLAAAGHVVAPAQLDLGLAEGRFLAVVNVFIRPGRREADLLILLAAALVIAIAIRLRRTQAALGRTELVMAAAALALYTARAVVSVEAQVLGFLPAVPLAVAGLVLLTRSRVSGPGRTMTVGFAAFAVAIAAVAYPAGGVADWGGRYLAVALPLALAPAAVGLLDHWHRRDWAASALPATRRSVASFLVAGAVLLNAMGLIGLHRSRALTADLDELLATTITTERAADGKRPVVVSRIPAVPRLAWKQIDRARWLLVEPSPSPADGVVKNVDDDDRTTPIDGAFTDLADRLHDLGIDEAPERLILVTTDPERDLRLLSGRYTAVPAPAQWVGSVAVLVVQGSSPAG